VQECRGIGMYCCCQVSIGQVILPVLHNLEQVSSDEHVGSLAENLLEALKENEKVSAKVSCLFISASSYEGHPKSFRPRHIRQ